MTITYNNTDDTFVVVGLSNPPTAQEMVRIAEFARNYLSPD